MAKTFQQLKISLGDWLVVNDTPGQFDSVRLPESIRGDMINMAIRELLRKHDTRFGELSFNFDTVAAVSVSSYTAAYASATPAPGFSRPRSLWYVDPTNSKNIVYLEFLEKIRFDLQVRTRGTLHPDQIGNPTLYTYWAGNFELGLVPGSALTIYGTCYRLLPDLVNANDTNGVTEDAWEYVLFKALSMAEQFGIEDERIPAWEGRAEKLAMDLVVEHFRSLASAKTNSQSREP